jgi:uncharacterized OB-fold protein
MSTSDMSTGGLPSPAPYVSPETKEFWEATADHRLLLRHCDGCGSYIWYPRPFCPSCGSTETSWAQASGRGTVYTFTVVHRSGVPGYIEALPYVIAYVQLDEGPRIMTNIVGIEPGQVRVDMPVTVVFHDTGHGSALFRFRPDPGMG